MSAPPSRKRPSRLRDAFVLTTSTWAVAGLAATTGCDRSSTTATKDPATTAATANAATHDDPKPSTSTSVKDPPQPADAASAPLATAPSSGGYVERVPDGSCIWVSDRPAGVPTYYHEPSPYPVVCPPLPPAPKSGFVEVQSDGTCLWRPDISKLKPGFNPPMPHLVECPKP